MGGLGSISSASLYLTRASFISAAQRDAIPGGIVLFLGGFHPVGARWIQEHYTLDPVQETFSYYGGLNLLTLNVGYHNEHHDFAVIPWNRLPKLRAMAPEFYDTLKYHNSYMRLWLQFLFDSRYNLFSRVERSGPGKAGVKEVSQTEPEKVAV